MLPAQSDSPHLSPVSQLSVSPKAVASRLDLNFDDVNLTPGVYAGTSPQLSPRNVDNEMALSPSLLETTETGEACNDNATGGPGPAGAHRAVAKQPHWKVGRIANKESRSGSVPVTDCHVVARKPFPVTTGSSEPTDGTPRMVPVTEPPVAGKDHSNLLANRQGGSPNDPRPVEMEEKVQLPRGRDREHHTGSGRRKSKKEMPLHPVKGSIEKPRRSKANKPKTEPSATLHPYMHSSSTEDWKRKGFNEADATFLAEACKVGEKVGEDEMIGLSKISKEAVNRIFNADNDGVELTIVNTTKVTTDGEEKTVTTATFKPPHHAGYFVERVPTEKNDPVMYDEGTGLTVTLEKNQKASGFKGVAGQRQKFYAHRRMFGGMINMTKCANVENVKMAAAMFAVLQAMQRDFTGPAKGLFQ